MDLTQQQQPLIDSFAPAVSPDDLAGPTAPVIEHTWIRSGRERLAASLDLPGTPTPWPVVMLIHGFSGHRLGRSNHFVEFGQMLASRGVACVRFDQAGCGESTGDSRTFSLATIHRDCRAVYDWISHDPRFRLDRFAIVGSSMGAIPALAIDVEHESLGLVFWAPVFDLPDLVASKVSDAYVVSAVQAMGFVSYRGLRLGSAYFDNLGHLKPADLLARASSPILVFHALHDETVPFDHATQYEQACRRLGRSCTLVEFDDRTHDFYEEPSRSRLLRASTHWLLDRLTTPAASPAPSPALA